MLTRHPCSLCHGLGVDDQGRPCPYIDVHRAATTPKEIAMHNISSPRPVTDETIETEIVAKGLTAPRITPVDIDRNIADAFYFTAAQGAEKAARDAGSYMAGSPAEGVALNLLTFCVLVLRNGFTVTGESACASPENFDADVGRKIARTNAVQKIWALMGYELKSKLVAA